MDTVSLVLEYLKDLKECMDDGDSKIAKESKVFDALEHKSVVIEVDNQKIAIFTKAPLRAFGEPFMREFLVTTKSQVDFGLGELRINLTTFREGIEVIDITKEVGSSSEEVVQMGKANQNKSYNINKLTTPPSLRLEEIPPTSTKKLDEILIGKERLNKKEFSEEEKVGIIKLGLPKKMYDPRNYVLPVKINGVVEMVALVDTEASVSVLPYSLYKDLGLGDPRPYRTNLIMADNMQVEAMGEVVIDMGRGTLCIDDGVICHTYFPKPRTKSYVEAFEMEGEDDWLGSFKVGRDENGNVKYGPVSPSFIDIKDDMERALVREAYFKYWGNEGYGSYKKVDGDGDCHARFEIITPSGRKFNRAFKTKTTIRKLSGKFKTEDVLRFSHFLD
nr:hypothetical protein [Tanacetum cinerariifolium]